LATAPPVVAAVQVTVADALPAVAVPMVGAAGAAGGEFGVTAALLADSVLVPTPFVAATVNWEPVPLVSEATFAVVTLPTTSGLPTTAPVAEL
jgi:hypothetical protein